LTPPTSTLFPYTTLFRSVNHMKKIVMIGCFDTKAEVFQYLYQQLTSLGSPILSINTGLFGSTELFPVNLENEELAAFVRQDLAELTKKGNRNEAVKVMAEAARQKIQQLVEMGEVGGVIGMGGGGGTYIALKAMQNVPFGIPKLCISTLATKDVSNLVGDRKSTRLNSSHVKISYAVFCLKKKTKRTYRCTA